MVSRDLQDPQFATLGSPHLSFPIEAPTLGSSQPRKGDAVDPRLLCCPGGLASLPRLCPLSALEQGYRLEAVSYGEGAPYLSKSPVWKPSEESFHCPHLHAGSLGHQA